MASENANEGDYCDALPVENDYMELQHDGPQTLPSEYQPVQPGYPPQQPGYPTQKPGNPPQQPGYLTQKPGNPLQQSGYPPQQPSYPPQQHGYPPQQPSYPPQQHGYPPQQPGNPPQQSGLPNIPPTYPPVYSTQQPGMVQGTTAPTVFIQQPFNTVFIADRSYKNFTGAILLSCFVYWCCGGLFGFIAFILAMVGQSSAASGDSQSAKSLLKASYITSVVGMVLTVIVVIILVIVFTTTPSRTTYNYDTATRY